MRTATWLRLPLMVIGARARASREFPAACDRRFVVGGLRPRRGWLWCRTDRVRLIDVQRRGIRAWGNAPERARTCASHRRGRAVADRRARTRRTRRRAMRAVVRVVLRGLASRRVRFRRARLSGTLLVLPGRGVRAGVCFRRLYHVRDVIAHRARHCAAGDPEMDHQQRRDGGGEAADATHRLEDSRAR
jgi:hypothetical protein